MENEKTPIDLHTREQQRIDRLSKKDRRNEVIMRLDGIEYRRGNEERKIDLQEEQKELNNKQSENARLMNNLMHDLKAVFAMMSLTESHGRLAVQEALLLQGEEEPKSKKAAELFELARTKRTDFLRLSNEAYPLRVKDKREGLTDEEDVLLDELHLKVEEARTEYERLFDEALNEEYKEWVAVYGSDFNLAMQIEQVERATLELERECTLYTQEIERTKQAGAREIAASMLQNLQSLLDQKSEEFKEFESYIIRNFGKEVYERIQLFNKMRKITGSQVN